VQPARLYPELHQNEFIFSFSDIVVSSRVDPAAAGEASFGIEAKGPYTVQIRPTSGRSGRL
jgi:hypothetical protein